MKKLLFILLVISFSLSGCEKDDICDGNTPTTPRLVIAFYDISNTSTLKNVTRLKVIGEGMENGIIFNENATDDDQYITNANTISIPLKTDSDETTYSFILNYGNSNPALTNEDKITFKYTRENIYVSRACGFKTIFTFDSKSINQTDSNTADGLWMQVISKETNNIESENETHIKIYF